ncbi:MAG: class 1b ribonucleoside-diphosphate reductase subunit beta [Culicoidibacterales bacterium]
MKAAVNWNRMEDEFTKVFWDQNVRQFWVDEEIPLTDDKLTYAQLLPEERWTYERILGGLTLLDTEQGDVGMPLLGKAVEKQQQKAVLSFMGAMEHMHAKSYSSIFSTLCTMPQIDTIFEWVVTNEILQTKVDVVTSRYEAIRDQQSLYEAMATSVFLESFLFYSGFFYPLYLAGQGKLINSGEIINLIIRDEAIHGMYTGMLAQGVFETLTAKQQQDAVNNVQLTFEQLYGLEQQYTRELYQELALESEVETFIRYNADKAMMNIGLDPVFQLDPSLVNPLVLNGLRTETKNHDFFSTKGNGYVKAMNVESLQDSDFYF